MDNFFERPAEGSNSALANDPMSSLSNSESVFDTLFGPGELATDVYWPVTEY